MNALVRVQDGDQVTRVTLPVFYPSGSVVTVEVASWAQGFRVSDSGLAHREVDLIGADHLFKKNANAVAEHFGLECATRSVWTDATVETLAAAIADVGAASAQIAHRIVERVASRSEAAIEAELYRRLVYLFGQPKVAKDVEITGASSHRWRISALVSAEGRDVVFEAVSNHHSSVYSSATMFHDLSLLDGRPVSVAVVRDKKEMGDYLSILSQAANVIQDNAPDDTIARLVAA